MSRVCRGGEPDVGNFLRFTKWLGWRWSPPRS
jgi:hypothetical protein